MLVLLRVISHQMVDSLFEMLVQSAKEVFAIVEMFGDGTVDLRDRDGLIFADVLLSIFVIENIVPSLPKVNPETVDNRTRKRNADIRPAHSAALGPVEFVVLPLSDVLEVVNSGIVVILTREDNIVQVSGVSIGDGVSVGVPAAEANIQTTHKGNLAIDKAQLFVVSPEQHHIVMYTIKGLNGIPRGLGKIKSLERQVLQRLEGRHGIISAGVVVWMSENLESV